MISRRAVRSAAVALAVGCAALSLSACGPRTYQLIGATDLVRGAAPTLIAHFPFDGNTDDATRLAEEVTSSAGIVYQTGVKGDPSSSLSWNQVAGDSAPPLDFQNGPYGGSGSTVLSFLLPPDRRPGCIALWVALSQQSFGGSGLWVLLCLEEAGHTSTRSPPTLLLNPGVQSYGPGTVPQISIGCSFYNSQATNSYMPGAPASGLPAANWFHLALSVDPAGEYTWCMNGVAVGSTRGPTFGTPAAGSRWRVYIVGGSGGSGSPGSGSGFALDELMVFDQPIQPAQAAALFQAGLAP